MQKRASLGILFASTVLFKLLECSPRLKPGDFQFNPNSFRLRKSYVGSLGS
jgi:hypothetical protein